jgi:ribose transport system permease protein
MPGQPLVLSRIRRSVPVHNFAILGVLVAICLTFWVISPGHVFLDKINLQGMGQGGAEILIMAVGETFVLISGELDLSIGSTLVLGGAVAVNVMVGLSPSLGAVPAVVIGSLAALACGVGVGFVNGVVTTRLRVPSFVVTLGTLGIALGIADLLTSGSLSQTVPPVLTTSIGTSEVLSIPTISLIAAVVAFVGWYVLSKTRFGAHCAAIGSNRASAIRAGVRTDRARIMVFVLMGFLAGLASVLDIARFTTISVASHTTDNLEAISAVIIGGTSLFGGRGSVGGTVIGTLIPVTLLSGLVIQGVSPFWQNIAIGVILIAAVAIDQSQRERLFLSGTGRGAGGAAAEDEDDDAGADDDDMLTDLTTTGAEV